MVYGRCKYSIHRLIGFMYLTGGHHPIWTMKIWATYCFTNRGVEIDTCWPSAIPLCFPCASVACSWFYPTAVNNKKAIYNLGMVWTTMYHPFMVFYGEIGEGLWHWVYHIKIDENVQWLHPSVIPMMFSFIAPFVPMNIFEHAIES